MGFAWILWRAADGNRLWILAAVAAITGGMVSMMALINVVIAAEDPRNIDFLVAGLFIAAAVAVLSGQLLGPRVSARIIESMLDGYRMRIVAHTRRIEYSDFEAVGGTRIYDALTRNGAVISEAAAIVIPGYAAMGSLLLAGIYTVLLSPVVFAALGGIILVSVFFFSIQMRKVRTALGESSQAETDFLKVFQQLLGGIKEVRLHRPRGEDLESEHLRPGSLSFRAARLRAVAGTSQATVVSLFFFYLVLGTIAFILPPIIDDSAIIAQSLYVSIFLLGTVETILRSVPLMSRALLAVNDLQALEADLEQRGDGGGLGPDQSAFESIELDAITYSYRNMLGEPVATTGPVSLRIARGELLYCVGGNGSGKSTFLKMLCRLYPPDSGMISVDGTPVTSENAGEYRALFSTVFADFHLFDRLYGLTGLDEAVVNSLLDELEIGGKVNYADGAFSTTELSTGQRKRLAFAVAILEKRPILVLDELSADQDPEFRDKFYRYWLPKLKADGWTLVVVSHDDRYFELADRAVHFRDGQIVENSSG